MTKWFDKLTEAIEYMKKHGGYILPGIYPLAVNPVSDCIINQMFTDANDPAYHREQYCQKNCSLHCSKKTS